MLIKKDIEVLEDIEVLLEVGREVVGVRWLMVGLETRSWLTILALVGSPQLLGNIFECLLALVALPIVEG